MRDTATTSGQVILNVPELVDWQDELDKIENELLADSDSDEEESKNGIPKSQNLEAHNKNPRVNPPPTSMKADELSQAEIE